MTIEVRSKFYYKCIILFYIFRKGSYYYGAINDVINRGLFTKRRLIYLVEVFGFAINKQFKL